MAYCLIAVLTIIPFVTYTNKTSIIIHCLKTLRDDQSLFEQYHDIQIWMNCA